MSLFTQFFAIFFFNDTATTEIYTLSLHDALPIYQHVHGQVQQEPAAARQRAAEQGQAEAARHLGAAPLPPPPLAARDRKSTRLNSSHANISYAVFCLKKKNKTVHIYVYRYTLTLA